MSTESMAYVSYCAECDGMIAAMVDKPEYRRGKDGTARFVADEIREGNRIERVTCQYVRENLKGCTDACGCKWCVKARAKAANAEAQPDLLAGAGSPGGME